MSEDFVLPFDGHGEWRNHCCLPILGQKIDQEPENALVSDSIECHGYSGDFLATFWFIAGKDPLKYVKESWPFASSQKSQLITSFRSLRPQG